MTSIADRIRSNNDLKLTETEFQAIFPEVDYTKDKPLLGSHPFVVRDGVLYGTYGIGFNIAVHRLAVIDQDDGTILQAKN